jgi:hypothetical protein
MQDGDGQGFDMTEEREDDGLWSIYHYILHEQ